MIFSQAPALAVLGNRAKLTKQSTSAAKPVWLLLGLLAIFSLLFTACARKTLLSIPLSTQKNLVFVAFRQPPAGWPYGFDGETFVPAEKPFALSATEVPYRLWYTVRLWAEERGYQFVSLGAEGSEGLAGQSPQLSWQAEQQMLREQQGVAPWRYRDAARSQFLGQPVSQVSWGDAAIWCNALSEYYNWYWQNQSSDQRQQLELQLIRQDRLRAPLAQRMEPVYRQPDGQVLRSAAQANVGLLQNEPQANGFRLPSEKQWELASRWQNGRDWQAGNWAAGARNDYNSLRANIAVAWYSANSQNRSWPVASRHPSATGLFDMSGNLAEWMADRFQPVEGLTSDNEPLPFRTIKGGAYLSPASELQVAGRLPALPQQAHKSIGFRLVLPLDPPTSEQ